MTNEPQKCYEISMSLEGIMNFNIHEVDCCDLRLHIRSL